MKERPMLFSAPMVRAILAGTKTQTRRICHERSPHWIVGERNDGRPWLMVARDSVRGANINDDAWCPASSPYGAPGDRLWVRETHALVVPNGTPTYDGARVVRDDRSDELAEVWYRADGELGLLCYLDDDGPRWRPSIYMPRWASRITLEVTEVRVERLQAITQEEARAEGLSKNSKDGGITWKWGLPDRDGLPGTDDDGQPWHEWDVDARKPFAALWDNINGKRAPWASNPWVWVVSFRRVS